jgi:hypothetical protein
MPTADNAAPPRLSANRGGHDVETSVPAGAAGGTIETVCDVLDDLLRMVFDRAPNEPGRLDRDRDTPRLDGAAELVDSRVWERGAN